MKQFIEDLLMVLFLSLILLTALLASLTGCVPALHKKYDNYHPQPEFRAWTVPMWNAIADKACEQRTKKPCKDVVVFAQYWNGWEGGHITILVNDARLFRFPVTNSVTLRFPAGVGRHKIICTLVHPSGNVVRELNLNVWDLKGGVP